jgi:hypothetical protein
MAWLKLDDQIFLNRKVAQCDSDTKLLYIVGLTYCANQLTDGFIPEATLPLLAGMAGLDWQIAKQSAGKLLDVCLWVATDKGWQIPDYLDYNPSREQVIHNQQVRSEAGKRGGYAKSKQNAGKLPSKTQANAKQNPGKSLPPSPSPNDDDKGMKEDDEDHHPLNDHAATNNGDGKAEAIDALQEFGLFNQPLLAQFNDLWPELAGRRDWVGKAVTVARDKGASSPAYPLKVLLNAVHTNKAPGARNGNDPKRMAETQTDYDALKARYAPKHLEELIEH